MEVASKLQEEPQQQRMDNVIQRQLIKSKGIFMRKDVTTDNSWFFFTRINTLTNNGVVVLF